MTISVITVCLNVVETIEKTILSVLNQTYKDIEYIVIDGESKDGTLQIIDKYLNHTRIELIVEKDTGIYNAMNKGVRMCHGDYIIFLNSGDIFCNNSVIERIVGQAKKDIIYGNVIRRFSEESRLEKYTKHHDVLWLLLKGKMPCHQVLFTKVSVMRKYKFDETYYICADFDFLVRCRKDKVIMQYIDIDVSEVDCITGISSQNSNLKKMRNEDDRSIKHNYRFFYFLLWIPKNIFRFYKDVNNKFQNLER